MAVKSSAQEGNVNHYGLVRLRVSGVGSLKLRLNSLGNVKESILVPLIMAAATNIEPTRLSNFTQQGAQLEVKTTAINENFVISKIILFIRPVATSYPGN